MTNEVTVSDDSFEAEVIESKLPVLVDFWAEWCAPCTMVAPILKDIAEDYAGKVKVAKVDIDDNEKLAAKYGITSIPTILLFKDGKMVNQQLGVMSYEAIENMFNDYI